MKTLLVGFLLTVAPLLAADLDLPVGSTRATQLAFDDAGHVYALGRTTRSAAPPGLPAVGALGDGDVIVSKWRLDPLERVWAVAIGGAATDTPESVALDADGAVYVSGHTGSSDFPTTPGAYQPQTRALPDNFVLKIQSGGELGYSSYFPAVADIAVDAAGSLWAVGAAGPGFPVTENAFQREPGGGECRKSGISPFPPLPCTDAVLLRLSADGGAIEYATYLGGAGGPLPPKGFGPGDDAGLWVALAGNGDVLVGGTADSRDFPTTPGLIQDQSDTADIFLARFDPSGRRLLASTLLGATDRPNPPDFALDDAGDVIVVHSESEYGYLDELSSVSKVAADGTRLLYRTEVPFSVGLAPVADGRVVVIREILPRNRPTRFCLAVTEHRLLGATGELEGSRRLRFGSVPAATPDGRIGYLLDETWGDRRLAFLDPAAAPGPFIGCLVNAASLLSSQRAIPVAVAPNELVTLFGSGLGPAEGLIGEPVGPIGFPYGLGDIRVLFDGEPAQLLWVQEGQINASAPSTLAVGDAVDVRVERSGEVVASIPARVVGHKPGVFTESGDGRGRVLAFHADGSRNSYQNPAAPGDVVDFFATGLGATGAVEIRIGDRAVPDFELHASPNAPGLMRVRIRVPDTARPGDWVHVVAAGARSQSGAGLSIMPPSGAADLK